MTLPDFYDKYCTMCGTNRCGGVYDVVWREGCEHFKKEFLSCNKPNFTNHTGNAIDYPN